jgi:hypothetical protein
MWVVETSDRSWTDTVSGVNTKRVKRNRSPANLRCRTDFVSGLDLFERMMSVTMNGLAIQKPAQPVSRASATQREQTSKRNPRIAFRET